MDINDIPMQTYNDAWTLEEVDMSMNVDGVLHTSDKLRASLTVIHQSNVKATIYKRVNSVVDLMNRLAAKARDETPSGQDLYHTILVSPHTHMMMLMVFPGLPSLSVAGVSIRPTIIFGGEIARVQYALVTNSVVASLETAGFMCDVIAPAWFGGQSLAITDQS